MGLDKLKKEKTRYFPYYECPGCGQSVRITLGNKPYDFRTKKIMKKAMNEAKRVLVKAAKL